MHQRKFVVLSLVVSVILIFTAGHVCAETGAVDPFTALPLFDPDNYIAVQAGTGEKVDLDPAMAAL